MIDVSPESRLLNTRGRLRSMMARTTLGLDMADTFTSSDKVVKGMNCRMLPRLPCSRQSTHSSMNH